MKYLLVVPPEVEKSVVHLPPLLKRRIRHALQEIQSDPHAGKPLKDQLEGLYSYRVARYRIVYRIARRKIQVQVIDIGPRNIIYQHILEIVKSTT